MLFKMKHLYFNTLIVEEQTFTEDTAPDWLTGAKTVKGSTMDMRWFWNDHVLTLGVGESVKTDFQIITRIE
jgi:hypothetical protein